ncbi:hypothetical protein EJ110_NYTH12799 [Nymphaea thermarum]|nr:hypothetical protein EJ110_NYTH12799 [Nymphaea thermarum]
MPPRKSPGFHIPQRDQFKNGGSALSAAFFSGSGLPVSSRRFSRSSEAQGCANVTCHKCGEQFGKWEALESHLLIQTSWLKSESHCGRIERVLKVHNMQKTLARFEEYREMVKIKASKLPKKHPRCLADGNELLRFYGTTVTCSLGMNDLSNLCISEKCSVCWIIRHGFSTKKEMKGGIGVFTTSTSGRLYFVVIWFLYIPL